MGRGLERGQGVGDSRPFAAFAAPTSASRSRRRRRWGWPCTGHAGRPDRCLRGYRTGLFEYSAPEGSDPADACPVRSQPQRAGRRRPGGARRRRGGGRGGDSDALTGVMCMQVAESSARRSTRRGGSHAEPGVREALQRLPRPPCRRLPWAQLWLKVPINRRAVAISVVVSQVPTAIYHHLNKTLHYKASIKSIA